MVKCFRVRDSDPLPIVRQVGAETCGWFLCAVPGCEAPF